MQKHLKHNVVQLLLGSWLQRFLMKLSGQLRQVRIQSLVSLYSLLNLASVMKYCHMNYTSLVMIQLTSWILKTYQFTQTLKYMILLMYKMIKFILN